MSWFDKFFRKSPKNSKFAPTFDGWMPIYSQFGTDIYASDVVQQALKCIVDEMKKLKPAHIRVVNNDVSPVMSDLQEVLNNPNPLMTTSEFIEKTMWLLLLNFNAFIIPTYYTWVDKKTGVEKRYYEALYPINPTQVDFIEDAYTLEVSSPGLGRQLKKDRHFENSLGKEVELKLYKAIDGVKEFAYGKLNK